MDLDEYLFYQQRKNPHFTHRQFAKMLGIDHTTFSRILKGQPMSLKLAYKIEIATEGKISAWELLKKSHKLEKIDKEHLKDES